MAAALTAAVVLIGCGGGNANEDTLESLAEAGLITTTTIDRSIIGDFPDVTQEIDLLIRDLGAPLMMRAATVNYDQVAVQVQNKDNPEDVDSYFYRFDAGSWSNPAPVSLNVKDIDQLEDRLFDASSVAWQAIPTLGPAALEAFEELEVPAVSAASIGRSVARSGEEVFNISISVTGLRGSGVVLADARTGDIVLQERR